jgi:hypothetical protein
MGSINRFSNPKPVYCHTPYTRQYNSNKSDKRNAHVTKVRTWNWERKYVDSRNQVLQKNGRASPQSVNLSPNLKLCFFFLACQIHGWMVSAQNLAEKFMVSWDYEVRLVEKILPQMKNCVAIS